jgi:hypothetical protein
VNAPVQTAELHEVPLGLAGLLQVPVPVLQAPGSWQASGTGQTTEAPGTHAPDVQVSFCVQALPSLQDDELATLKQVPTWVGTLHAMQSVAELLPHGESQQTPSIQ